MIDVILWRYGTLFLKSLVWFTVSRKSWLVILRSHWIHVKSIQNPFSLILMPNIYVEGKPQCQRMSLTTFILLMAKCGNARIFLLSNQILRENNNSFMVLKIIVKCNMVSRKFKVKVKFAKFHTMDNSCLEIVLHDFLR